MNLTARFVLLIASLAGASLLAGTASAYPAALKCNSQRDQIWVYDSLNSFGVEAKLKCGDNVEIIERVKDYVKIRAKNGVEGYVPQTAVADLPPLEVRQDPTHDVGLVAKQAQAKEIANATAKAAADAAEAAHRSAVSQFGERSLSEKQQRQKVSCRRFHGVCRRVRRNECSTRYSACRRCFVTCSFR